VLASIDELFYQTNGKENIFQKKLLKPPNKASSMEKLIFSSLFKV